MHNMTDNITDILSKETCSSGEPHWLIVVQMSLAGT